MNHARKDTRAQASRKAQKPGSNKAERGQQKKGSRKKVIKGISIALAVLLVCAIGGVVYLYSMYKKINADPLAVLVKNESGHTTTVIDEEGTEKEYVRQEHMVNILLLGVDSDSEREALQMGYRSDVMIVCTLNFDDNTMTMMSIPRDSYVPMNKLDYKTGAVKTRVTDKIAHAYAFGGGPKHFGEKNATDCVKELLSCNGKLNIEIDYYASIDMDGIPKLVDAVGGVSVVLDRSISGLGSKGQTITITSSNVDEYVRKRKGDGGGDEGRNDRQQELIIALAKKIKSMGAVNAATKLYGEATQYINTNANLEEVLALASFLQGFNLDTGLTQYRVEVSPKRMDGIYYEIIDEAALYNFSLNHFYAVAEK